MLVFLRQTLQLWVYQKDAYITIYVTHFLEKQEIRFLIMGICNSGIVADRRAASLTRATGDFETTLHVYTEGGCGVLQERNFRKVE